MTFFGKNIKKIRGVKRLSQQAFADLFDLKRGTLGAYEEGRSEPKLETIIRIANYFSVSIDSLLTHELTVNQLLQFKGDIAAAIDENQLKEFTQIPCLTVDKISEYCKNFTDKGLIETLPKLQLPVMSKRKLRGYIIHNLEMAQNESGLYPKDVVIGEAIPKIRISDLEEGTLSMLLLEEDFLIRRIFINDNKIVLKADHESVPDKEINPKELKELWVVKYIFNHRLPYRTNSLEERVRVLEQEFTKLKSSLGDK